MDNIPLGMHIDQNIRKWLPLLVLLVITYLIGIYSCVYKPLFNEVLTLKDTYPMFALSFQAFLLLLACAVVLYKTWLQGNKRNKAHIFWAAGFALYAAMFFGLMLEAMGVSFANMHIPSIFFMWRQLMIIWAALVYYGISEVVFKNNALSKIPTALILVVGYAIFAYGLLFGPKNIEWTMYGFLALVFVPVCFLVSFLFYIYWKEAHIQSPGYLSLGFLGIGLTYLAWSPWHMTNFYFIWFALFVLSLVPTLVGIIMIRHRTDEPIIQNGTLMKKQQ